MNWGTHKTSATPTTNAQKVPTPIWNEFLAHITKDDVHFKNLLRAVLLHIITGDTSTQKIYYIYGTAASGKSVFCNLVAAFFPPAAVIRANLSHICNNIFEAANLRNRTLVILNDIDEYPGKLSILKSLSGGESIRSQIKYAQESVAVEPTFSFLVTANQTFRLKSDAGGAIARRLLNIAFPHACPPEARKNLV